MSVRRRRAAPQPPRTVLDARLDERRVLGEELRPHERVLDDAARAAAARRVRKRGAVRALPCLELRQQVRAAAAVAQHNVLQRGDDLVEPVAAAAAAEVVCLALALEQVRLVAAVSSGHRCDGLGERGHNAMAGERNGDAVVLPCAAAEWLSA